MYNVQCTMYNVQCICIYIYIYEYSSFIHICVQTHTYTYINIYIYTHALTHICLCIYTVYYIRYRYIHIRSTLVNFYVVLPLVAQDLVPPWWWMPGQRPEPIEVRWGRGTARAGVFQWDGIILFPYIFWDEYPKLPWSTYFSSFPFFPFFSSPSLSLSICVYIYTYILEQS